MATTRHTEDTRPFKIRSDHFVSVATHFLSDTDTQTQAQVAGHQR